MEMVKGLTMMFAGRELEVSKTDVLCACGKTALGYRPKGKVFENMGLAFLCFDCASKVIATATMAALGESPENLTTTIVLHDRAGNEYPVDVPSEHLQDFFAAARIAFRKDRVQEFLEGRCFCGECDDADEKETEH